MRLMLKNQIMVFNRLLEDQLQIMNKEFPSGIPSMSLPNGSNTNQCRTSIPSFGASVISHQSLKNLKQYMFSFTKLLIELFF